MPIPIVTFTLFRYVGFRRSFFGFSQMGLVPWQLTPGLVSGLRFGKIMGSGHGNGFSLRPNFSTYALLCIWDDEASADAFFSQHHVFQKLSNRAAEHFTAYLYTCASHGAWGGENPFEVTHKPDPTRPMAVLTRATIRTTKLLDFWKYVPVVSRSMDGMPGRILSIGVGELPVVQQATFSLWQQMSQMTNYAYRSAAHAEVVKLTRERNWYREELFARFIPFRCIGTWESVDNALLVFETPTSGGGA